MPEPLTNTELAILGLVAERPKHGYQIEQDIEQRGMRNWTEIGFSSIYYILNKLESSGWLASELSAPVPEPVRSKGASHRGGPARRVYHLTEEGQAVYRDAVWQRLSRPRPRTGDFDLALANLPALPFEQVLEGLAVYRESLRARLSHLHAKQPQDEAAAQARGEGFPYHAALLYSHSRVTIESELAWVEAVIAAQAHQAEGI